MRSHRSIADLVRRLGLTLDSGASVRSLPYAEGISLTTLVDDWRGLIVPPVQNVWACTMTRLLDAANLSGLRLITGNSSARILGLETQGNCFVFLRSGQVNPPTANGSTSNSFLLSGTYPLDGGITDPSIGFGNPIAVVDGFSTSGAGALPSWPGTTISPGILDAIIKAGWYLTPGQELWVTTTVINVGITARFVWLEIPPISADPVVRNPRRLGT